MKAFLANKYKAVLNLCNIARREGLDGVWHAIEKTLRGATGDENLYANYPSFIEQNKLSDIDIQQRKDACQLFAYRPLISIIVPVYNVDARWLTACIESVTAQYYPNWELCLYDDCSTNAETIACLKQWENHDSRIRIAYGSENKHISEASNRAIAMANGEFIGLLDHDDALTPDALYEVVLALNNNRDIDFIYSDEDKIDEHGFRSNPFFKPDYSPDLFLSNNYICHFSVIRKSIGDRLGWFRKGFEGSQDYDLFLRIFETSPHIHHISRVLYHWRMLATSTSSQGSAKTYAVEAAKRALQDYVKRNALDATVENGLWYGSFRVKYNIIGTPLVSIIIPFCDKVDYLSKCVDSIFEKTQYTNFEIILVNNNSVERKTQAYLQKIAKKPNVQILAYTKEFNYSAINNYAVQYAKGDFLLLLNNDTKVISPNWIESMLEHAQRSAVGAVGAKLLFANNTVQHAGVLLGVGGVANHAYYGMYKDTTAYWGHLHVVRNYSAVTGACLMIKKLDYLSVGGLDETHLKIAFNDVDLCLKLGQKGLLTVYTPHAELYHYESVSRGSDGASEKKERLERESENLMHRWGRIYAIDRFFNKNLSNINFSLKL